MSESGESGIPPVEQPAAARSGIGLAVIALILPVVAGTVLFFVKSFWLNLGISAATVLTTSVLVAIDARRLGNVDSNGKSRESPLLLFAGMCLLWIIVYPLAFFRRKHFGGPNLGVWSIAVVLFFGGGPLLYALLVPAELPSCTSSVVAQLLEQTIRGLPIGDRIRSVDSYREVRYDETVDTRHGECVAHTETGDIPVKFAVEWLDRKAGKFQVRILPSDLPSCDSPNVVQVLEQVIRGTPAGATMKSIDGYRELRYDSHPEVRQCACVLHADSGNNPLNFVVEWRDRDKGLFQVRVLTVELPSCTRPEVAQVLEQAIRSTPAGARVRFIDGHRELSFDPEANVRHGECVAHTETGDIPVRFVVEWQDRGQGRFLVRIVESAAR